MSTFKIIRKYFMPAGKRASSAMDGKLKIAWILAIRNDDPGKDG